MVRQAFAFAAVLALGGCSQGVLDPQGPVAGAELTILINSLGIMLAIVVPTIAATLGTAWWFRASNSRARYRPDWEYSGRLELIVWSIPAMTVLLLGGIGWVGSHDLDPKRPLAAARPLVVEVAALDWKWLFLYPGQGIASLNHVVIPAGTPIDFRITSSGVMNSFFVPQLGSQIYAMAGMVTQVQLLADKPGLYPGLSAQFSGDGFADMRFTVEAVPPDQFEAFVAGAAQGGRPLDRAAYDRLARPSKAVAPSIYHPVDPTLFDSIVHPDMPATAASPMEN
jgi:cytochrome o ubiquinol oxidase subunit 2